MFLEEIFHFRKCARVWNQHRILTGRQGGKEKDHGQLRFCAWCFPALVPSGGVHLFFVLLSLRSSVERGASTLCTQLSSAPEERGAWGSAGMLNHKETSDFCIVVAGGEAMFHVHSQLLRFHSRFFREMLREGVSPSVPPFLLFFLLTRRPQNWRGRRRSPVCWKSPRWESVPWRACCASSTRAASPCSPTFTSRRSCSLPRSCLWTLPCPSWVITWGAASLLRRV